MVDVDHGMKIMQEETFGPIIPIMKVTDETHAIQLANHSDFGLSASVWRGPTHAQADRLRERLMS
jgi:acyl-CoA reductase-like NAD-dependent aldehyde dehydrogenase